MSHIFASRKLADFIKDLKLDYVQYETPAYWHIGALYTNVVLQAGLNYSTVVRPRVSRVLTKYPEAATVHGFLHLIDEIGLEIMINWRHQEKIRRIYDVLEFSQEHTINTCVDLAKFLIVPANRERYLEIKGFGAKTLDYTLKLLNFDTIAVDRHLYSFIKLAGLEINDYQSAKKIVEFASDLLAVPRASIDYSIWLYMSNKSSRDSAGNQSQLYLGF